MTASFYSEKIYQRTILKYFFLSLREIISGNNPKMKYNTSQEKLIIPEYGRHVHNMVKHATQIEDKDQRNVAAQTIIGVMGSLMPHLRDSHDFKHKLWNHLFIMSEFKLDIDSPYPMQSPDELAEKPCVVPYPYSHIRQKHYGKSLVEMIYEAGKLSDCPQRDSLIQLLVAQMKKSYTLWNRSEISNEQIAQDIFDISDGKIKINPETIQFTEPVIKETPPTTHRHGHGYVSKRKKKMAGGMHRKKFKNEDFSPRQ